MAHGWILYRPDTRNKEGSRIKKYAGGANRGRCTNKAKCGEMFILHTSESRFCPVLSTSPRPQTGPPTPHTSDNAREVHIAQTHALQLFCHQYLLHYNQQYTIITVTVLTDWIVYISPDGFSWLYRYCVGHCPLSWVYCSTLSSVCHDFRGAFGWMDLLTTCIHHSELYFTAHWHTQTSVLNLLQSPLVVSWQRLLPKEILQLPALRSSCHSRPCRTLVNLTTQPTGSQAGGHFTLTS
jgi:hypothetical protein